MNADPFAYDTKGGFSMLAQTQYAQQRVLTTAQIAEAYAIESKSLMRSFQRHKERFVEGTHYYALTGEELKVFKGERQNDVSLKYASLLYLWTETGAFLLAKAVRTEQAFNAYNLLTEQYYRLANHQEVLPKALPYDAERFLALEVRVDEMEKLLQRTTLHSGEQKMVQEAVKQRVHFLVSQKAEQRKLFSALHTALKKRYAVGSYRDIPQMKLEEALGFIQIWQG